MNFIEKLEEIRGTCQGVHHSASTRGFNEEYYMQNLSVLAKSVEELTTLLLEQEKIMRDFMVGVGVSFRNQDTLL
jgi:hypothetical protein